MATESDPITVDPNFRADDDDGNSALDRDNASSTGSLASSILEYRKLHGRTFQNFPKAEYWTPNDERQNELLDIGHQMVLCLNDNKLFRSPIVSNPLNVIDIGTGTGIWAIDFADEYPSAVVIGTDLSPIQPTWVPPNCKFELDDANQSWTFPDNHFDFVHIRLLLGAIKDWPALYKEAYRCLKPGGWFEHTEFDADIQCDDNTLPENAAWRRYGGLIKDSGNKIGQTFDLIDPIPKWMAEAGFEKLLEFRYKLPLGGWPADPQLKEVGKYMWIATDQGVEGYLLYLLTKVQGWSIEETHLYISQLRQEMRKKYNTYFFGSTVCGQKPEAKKVVTSAGAD